MNASRLIMMLFFLQPIAFGAWLPRIPDVQAALGLSASQLAMALIGMPVGILSTLPFAGRLAHKIGPRNTLFYGFIGFFLVLPLVPFSGGLVTLFFTLLLLGAAMSIVELGLNLSADALEKQAGHLIMNRCHGFWSLGIMAGSLIGSVQIALRLSPLVSLVVLVAVLSLPSLMLTQRLPTLKDEETGQHEHFKWPGPVLMMLCVFIFGITMTEGAMADWSALYLRQVFALDGALAGLGYTVFALMVAVTRLGGDALKARFGTFHLASGCVIIGLMGLILLIIAPSPLVAFIGFALTGLGVSTGFPLSVTAAASLPDRPAASSVAIMSFASLTGFLVGPPMIGFIADLSSLRFGFTALIGFLFISLVFSINFKRVP